jgi:hypothetical protein
MNVKYICLIMFTITSSSCIVSKVTPNNKESACTFFDVKKKQVVSICNEPPFKGEDYDIITRIEITETDTSQYRRDIRTIKISEENIKLPFDLKFYLQNEYIDRCITLRLFTNNTFLSYQLTIKPTDWSSNKKKPFLLYDRSYPH